ncbi:hypothetical protein D3C77_69590 [compost metagenome]
MGQVDAVDLLDAAGARFEYHHAIGQEQCFLDVVGHQQGGDTRPFADRQQLFLHLLAGQGIEGAEGFVEQQDARAGHQATGNRHPLGHAARELVRVGLAEVLKPDQGDVVGNALFTLRCAQGFVDQAQGDVFPHRQPGKQAMLLEYDAALATDAGQRLAVDQDLPLVVAVQADQ